MKKGFVFMLIILLLLFPFLNFTVVYADDYIEDYVNTDEKDFYDRVEEIYDEEVAKGSVVKLYLIACVYHISSKYANMTFYDFDKETIRQLFKYMNTDPNIGDDEVIIYNEDAFSKNIKEYWLNNDSFSSFGYSDAKKDLIIQEMFDHYEQYKSLAGIEEGDSKGGTCSYTVKSSSVSNVNIQLLYCDGSGPIDSEELIDFEEYIVGVVSQENGNGSYEALKAQAVAARSYALMRPSIMNNAFGTSLKNDGTKWILSLRSCTNDQVFCNPNKGCWSNVVGGQTGSSSSWKQCTVYSGYDETKRWSRKPLAEDSLIRKAVLETRGEVAVDKNGRVAYTPYTDTNQKYWNSLAEEGYDYFEILKKDYDKISTIKSNCTGPSLSEADSWKQTDTRWKNQYIDTKTIGEVGCMVTSTAIQIARSNTKLNVSNFDPGVFVRTVKQNSGFSGNDFNVDDSTWADVAPNFKVGGSIYFTGSKEDKMAEMKKYINNNNYLIIRLYHPGQHWVAITSVSDGKIYMDDPASEAIDFSSKYDISTVDRGYYFVKTD